MNGKTASAERMMLQERVLSVKRRFLAMYKRANAGHIGSSLSCAELLVFLGFGWMRSDDSFILSKGHAAGALYALLAELGKISPEEIETFYEEGTHLSALPPFNAFSDIPFATGSLGYGLSLSAGMALGARLNGDSNTFFCVTSDGELNEGSVWEAALFIAHHELRQVIWIIDRNRIQAIGRTEDVMALEPLEDKLRAFGFSVIIANGHDFGSLTSARDEALGRLKEGSDPIVIIANTIKGHGISFMHDTVDCHYQPMSDRQYEQALLELDRDHDQIMSGYRHAE